MTCEQLLLEHQQQQLHQHQQQAQQEHEDQQNEQHMQIQQHQQVMAEFKDDSLQFLGQKRPRFVTSCLSMKTVMRWRLTGDVNLDHIFGCSDSCTQDEKDRAEVIMRECGTVICLICQSSLSANKKAVRRHQQKNRSHLSALDLIEKGAHILDPHASLLVASKFPPLPASVKKAMTVQQQQHQQHAVMMTTGNY